MLELLLLLENASMGPRLERQGELQYRMLRGVVRTVVMALQWGPASKGRERQQMLEGGRIRD